MQRDPSRASRAPGRDRIRAWPMDLALSPPHLPRMPDSADVPASRDRRERIERSPQFRGGRFVNPIPTGKLAPGTLWETLRLQLSRGVDREPRAYPPLPSLAADALRQPPASGLRATWLGHATALVEVDGARLLVDPVWGERASPLAFAGPRRFHAPPIAIRDLPPLDAVLVSHDHYDHLDAAAVRALEAAQPGVRWVASLGVGAHLERWGVAPARITELDWWETARVGAVEVTAGPARHFSGRGLVGGDRTLWSSLALVGPTRRVFYSGDTGPLPLHAEIGERLGPFDLTLVKIGAYAEQWPDIHVNPEQALDVHQAVRGRVLLPVHWGTFNLAFHAWTEPVDRLVADARRRGVALVIPRPGEPVEPAAVGVEAPPHPWWTSSPDASTTR
jgi:L-ascorbate metabolism protein UlaG (beta-lactamase superfamily)